MVRTGVADQDGALLDAVAGLAVQPAVVDGVQVVETVADRVALADLVAHCDGGCGGCQWVTEVVVDIVVVGRLASDDPVMSTATAAVIAVTSACEGIESSMPDDVGIQC